jgi:ECF transporter S component (folate family)
MALLIALGVLFKGYLTFMIGTALRIGLFELPIVLAGVLYGPMAGGLVGVGVDLLGYLINPGGVFFPGFTLSAALSGALPALILGKSRLRASPGAVFAAIGITQILNSLLLNALWLSILYGPGIWALLPWRAVVQVGLVPVFSLTVIYVERALKLRA